VDALRSTNEQSKNVRGLFVAYTPNLVASRDPSSGTTLAVSSGPTSKDEPGETVPRAWACLGAVRLLVVVVFFLAAAIGFLAFLAVGLVALPLIGAALRFPVTLTGAGTVGSGAGCLGALAAVMLRVLRAALKLMRRVATIVFSCVVLLCDGW
jgi:hypothetical protein